ncbi:DUF4124 domain-containing protein [Paracidovorax citrulli]|uniref:DUF4124 domain-containing protein n=1 Tax=Paracidovorax citrulli TaxID=80869 RepID=UPI0008830F1A|nr:DUF4124 domain-containing protein [Paracidovorax citrulli]UMT89050.1 DUF4124 domain-containing protein [Paracidovorax citrulli]WIY36204.1 DUF4124 domain-containing protein [Paracidovorax citrulli]SDK68061.1 protein of unknown function [Paracidovorax citrulli]
MTPATTPARIPSRPCAGVLGCAGLAAALWLAGAPVQAQVLRCTDPATGQVTYTDGSCGRGAAAREVEPRKTPEEIDREREQARAALETKRQRQEAEALAEQQQALREARESRARAGREVSTDPARSPECARSRRQLDRVAAEPGQGSYEAQARLSAAQRQMELDCLGSAGYTQVERSRGNGGATYGTQDIHVPPVVVVPRHPVVVQPAVPVPKPPGTQCNVFRCYDGNGNIYPR